MGNLSGPHLNNVTVTYYFAVPVDTESTTHVSDTMVVSVVTVVVSVVVSVEQEAIMTTKPRIRSFFMLQR